MALCFHKAWADVEYSCLWHIYDWTSPHVQTSHVTAACHIDCNIGKPCNCKGSPASRDMLRHVETSGCHPRSADASPGLADVAGLWRWVPKGRPHGPDLQWDQPSCRRAVCASGVSDISAVSCLHYRGCPIFWRESKKNSLGQQYVYYAITIGPVMLLVPCYAIIII